MRCSNDDELLRERCHIVEMLRNLALYLELGRGGGHIHKDHSSREREMLLCELASLKTAIPQLPAEERKAIVLVGLGGMTEREAACKLSVSQKAVNKRLWSAATRIQKIWRGRYSKGGSNGM